MNEPEAVATEAPAELNFEQLEAQLKDMPVLYGESNEKGPLTQQLEAAASEAEPEPAQEVQDIEASQPEMAETFTIEAAAEALQMDQTEFYKALQVPTGDGESLSLSEVQDRLKDIVRSDELLAEVQTNREKVETDLLHKNQALVLAQQQAGIEVTEEHLQQAAQQRQAYADLQDRTLTELQPEYAEPAYRQKFDSLVAKRLDAMGYNKQEQGFMKDARLRLEFHKHQRLLDEIAGVANKRVRTKRDQKPRVLTKSSNTVESIQSAGDTQNQKVEALGRLLG